MPKLGDAWVNIRANLKPLRKGLSRAAAVVKNAMRKIGRIARRLALIAVVGITAVSVAVIKLASDAVESENLYRVSMGKMRETTRIWSEELSSALGLNSFQVRKMTGILNVMFKSMGINANNAKMMAERLTELTFDLASFFNLKVEDAFAKIQSGMVGMVRPLRVLGILVDETMVKQFAKANGILKKNQKELTPLQKIYARFGLILKQSTAAQGDMIRTLEDSANVFRVIKARVTLLGIEIGNQLLPKVTEIARQFRDWLRDSKPQILAFTQAFVDKVIPAFENARKIAQEFFNIFKEQGAAATITIAFERLGNVVADTLIKNANKIGEALYKGFVLASVKVPFAIGKGIGEELFKDGFFSGKPLSFLPGFGEAVERKRGNALASNSKTDMLLREIANNTKNDGGIR